jgi:tetratricopeptide (TPR) repeat protein
MNLFKKSIPTVLLAFVFWSCANEKTKGGDDYFEEGNYQEAINAYSETLSLDPSNVPLLYGRARAKEEMQNLEGAIEDYKEALTYDDRNVRVLIGLGDIYYKQKDFANALFYYEQATGFEKNNAYALFKEGRAHHKLGNVEEAMDLYNDALRENNELGEAYLFRGALKVSQKNTGGACEDFRKAKSLNVSGAEDAIGSYCG